MEVGRGEEKQALTRPSDTLSHPMGEGGGEEKQALTCPADTLSHPMGEGWGEGAL